MCLGTPGKIVSINDADNQLAKMGQVSFSGVTQEVSLAYVPAAQIGDYVIVHAGMALQQLDTKEALQLLDDIKEINRLNDEAL